MRYFANFNANNGISHKTAITGFNKKELLKRIRSISLGNRFQGNECTWTVWDENDKVVFQGGYYIGVGIRYGVYNYKNLY